MRKSILLFVLLTLFGIPYLLAQGGFRITGQILSAEDNLPVIGVSVVEKGTTNGVITDIDGNYSITVSKSPATLQFSYVGMKTVEKLFTAATRYNVIMQPNTEMVDEVVVVAYGVLHSLWPSARLQLMRRMQVTLLVCRTMVLLKLVIH